MLRKPWRSPDADNTSPEADAEGRLAATATPARTLGRTRLASAWLALLGAAAVFVGGIDTIQGTEINVRVMGTFVLGAGFVLIAGAVGLRATHARGRSLAMVAALLGIALGALTFMAQAVSDEPDERLGLWAVIILLSVACAYHVRALTPQAERAQRIWDQLPFLKSTVTLGVLVSVAQFWYTSIYVPTTAPASLTLESQLSKATETDTRVVLKGVVTISNTSNTRVNVLASALDVRAETLVDANLGHKDLRNVIRDADDPARATPAERYVGLEKGALITHGRLVADGFYFEPGEVVKVPVTAWLPKDRYDRASMYATLTIARGRVLAVETEEPKIERMNTDLVLLTRVPEAGLLRKLTRSDRFVRTEYYSNIGAELSYREYQVAELLRRNRTDPQIAEKIGEDRAGVAIEYAYAFIPATKTVKRHVSNVLAKLGVRKRSDVAAALERSRFGYRVWFAPDNKPNPPKDFDERLRRLYGATNAFSTDVLALRR